MVFFKNVSIECMKDSSLWWEILIANSPNQQIETILFGG